MENKVFVTSDLHLCHNKLFVYEPRGFKSIEEMNNAIIKNWNEVVGADDEVWCLGDMMLMDNECGIALIKQLNGKIHIVRGNHDSDARVESYKNCPNVVEVVDAKYLRYGHYHFYLSHYPTITYNHDFKKPLKNIMVNVCGHSHVSDPFADWDKGYIFHVEADAHFCTPITLDYIVTSIKNRLEN